MGSLQTPPGHSSQALALITAKFGDLKIAVAPPDADLKVISNRDDVQHIHGIWL